MCAQISFGTSFGFQNLPTKKLGKELSGFGGACRVVRGRARHACDVCVNLQMPGDRRHLLPGHLPHGRTVAGAGVPHCAGTVIGDGCGRAALCAHGRAMPVTRLRVLRQMPHPVPAVCAVLMRGAAVRAPRSGRELVGRAGGIAAARAVACRVRVFWVH